MQAYLKKFFAELGYLSSYERFTQLPSGAAITIPAADAVSITTNAPLSLLIVPAGEGATPITVQTNNLFVLDSPFVSITISDVDGAVPAVRVTGFSKQTQES